MIHVDTSFAIDLMREHARQRRGPATAWIEEHHDEALGLSVFVRCELEAGAGRAAHPQRERARVRDSLSAYAILYPDERFAAAYGDRLTRMLARGRSIGVMDLLIATMASVDVRRWSQGTASILRLCPICASCRIGDPRRAAVPPVNLKSDL